MSRITTDVSQTTGLSISVRVILASVGTLIAIGTGIALYFQFRAVVPPTGPISVTGSTQTAIWEMNAPGDLTYDAAKINVTSTQTELKQRLHWWDTNYQYRIPLTITTGSTPATQGNTVVYRISTGSYVAISALRSDRRDLRVVYWDGATNTELDRDYVQHDDTRFALQADIAGNSSSAGEYYLYLGNPSAGAPPSDLSQVYDYYADFSSDVFTEFLPWQVYCGSATAPFTVSGGTLHHSVSTPSDCFAYKPILMRMTSNWYIEAKVKINSGTLPVVGSLNLHDSADTLASPNADGYWMGIVDNASDTLFVRNKLNTFAPTPVATTVTPGTFYRLTTKYEYFGASSRKLSGWLDGSPLITAANDTISNFASGYANPGVHVYQNGATLADLEWDDFREWPDLGETITIPNANYLEGQYYSDRPTVELKDGRGIRYGRLTAFSATGTPLNLISFILSNDNGASWQYFDTGLLQWRPSDGTFAQSSSAPVTNFGLSVAPFPQNGTLRWRALLDSQSPGTTRTVLDSVAAGFTVDSADRDGDGYANAAAGGNDCVDSLTSTYLEGMPGCTEFDPPTKIDPLLPGNSSVPIADHAWVQDDAGLYHLFFQDNVQNDWSILHYTTTDFSTLTYIGKALSRTAGAWDTRGAWAPHVIRKDGVYYLFYTGVDFGPPSSSVQRIGVATSTDLTTWTKVAVNNCSGTTGNGCVYDCTASWTAVTRGGAEDKQCRDPMVIFDPANGVWKLFATARPLSDSNQIVTTAYSTNLTSWTSEGYIEASHGAIAENPFVTQYNGNYYLFFTNYNSGWIKYAKSPTLATDSTSGSTNWVFQSSINQDSFNAPEVLVRNGDTWVFSMSGYAIGQGLSLKRMVWFDDGSFALANLTKPACRVSSQSVNPEAREICGDSVDNDCSGSGNETENWQCTNWGACSDSSQTRTCADASACGTVVNRPTQSQSCTATCTPNWSCGSWSACAAGAQTRTCADDNACGVDAGKPATSRECTVTPPPPPCVEDWLCGEWSACDNGNRTRSCRDRNACGTTVQKPGEQETCDSGGPDETATDLVIGVIPNRGQVPQTRLFDAKGTLAGQFLAYPKQFGRSGGSVGVGDVDGDKTSDVVTGTTAGSQPLLRLFDQRGKLRHQFTVYGTTSKAGITVAVGDLDGDGTNEVLTTPAANASGVVDLFRFDPARPWFTKLAGVTPKRGYTAGLSLATGDVDADGRAELIVSTIGRTEPRVFIYDYLPESKKFSLKKSFLVFAKSHRLGVTVAVGDVDGDGLAEIIASSGPGSRSDLRVFDGRGALKGRFAAAGPSFTGGAYPATADLNGDGKDEVLTVSNRSGAANIFVFGRTTGNRFSLQQSFRAFPTSFKTGLRLDATH